MNSNETPARMAARNDMERKSRQKDWEAKHTPAEVAVAMAERLAMLRLKLRHISAVKRVREVNRVLRDAQELAGLTKHPDAKRSVAAAAGFMMNSRLKASSEARSIQIAHAFMRGTSYARTEQICWTKPDWDRVGEIVAKYEHGDSRIYLQRYEQWTQAANKHLLDGAFKGYEPTIAETIDKLRHKRAKLDAALHELGAP